MAELCFVQWIPGVVILGVVGFLANAYRSLLRFEKAGDESMKALGLWGDEAIMSPKAHGTCPNPPLELRWGVNETVASVTCCFERDGAESMEPPGYWLQTNFLKEQDPPAGLTNFYDSVTGKKLFTVPRNRTFSEFKAESFRYGWLTFREAELDRENVRVLKSNRIGKTGEVVSVDGTHLGFQVPYWNGNLYCINIVSVAGPSPYGRGTRQPGPPGTATAPVAAVGKE